MNKCINCARFGANVCDYNAEKCEIYLKRKLNIVYRKEKKTMYEVTYSINGILKKINISAEDSVSAMNIFTNMYGNNKVQIINIVRR